MKLAKVLGMVGLCFAMAACGSKEESSVNGMKAADYFNQFVSAKTVSTCDGQTRTENSASGNIGGQSITLKLFNDGSFNVTSGWGTSSEIWSGSWSVDKTELVLNGVARASGITVNKATGLDISFPNSGDVPFQIRGQHGYLIRSTDTYQCRHT